MQPRQHDRPPLSQRLDRHAIRARGALVRHHLQQRRRQPARDLLHRHRRARPRVDDRLRHPHRTRARLRDFCCCDRQAQLHRRFLDRDRLPLPAGARPARARRALPRLPVLRGPPTSAGPSAVVLSSSGQPAPRAGTQQISWGKTLRFRRDHVANTPPGTRQEQGIAATGQLTPPRARLTALHSRSPPRRTYGFFQTRPRGSPPPLNTADNEPPGELRAAPLPSVLGSPCQGPSPGLTPPISTSCPAHRRTRPWPAGPDSG